MTSSTSGPGWSGDMLDRPEMVQAFAAQLRRKVSEYADFVAHVRRDAEAMWAENPPPEYGSFEAWWRHSQVTKPFAEIQKHLEAAATLTFRLEARYRKHRHEVPERKAAAAEMKQQHAALGRGGEQVSAPGPPAPPKSATAAGDVDFMDILRREGRSA